MTRNFTPVLATVFKDSNVGCPNGVSLPFSEGSVVQFPKHECEACPLRFQCTESKNGRSISIHPEESLLVELRERQTTESGRARLRERVSVEHDERSHWSMARR